MVNRGETAQVLTGTYYYSIDPKGRVMIPAPLREVIAANFSPTLIITKDLVDKCAVVFPYEEWVALLAKVNSLPKTNRAVKVFRRIVIGSAVEASFDKQGRVMIPASLRQDNELQGELVIVGVGDKIEIWDKAKWAEANVLDAESAQAVEQELSDLGV